MPRFVGIFSLEGGSCRTWLAEEKLVQRFAMGVSTGYIGIFDQIVG